MNLGWDGMEWEWSGWERRREEKRGRYGRVVIMGQNKHYSSVTY